MHIIYAEKYVSPRERPLTPEEAEVRRIAYAIKVPTSEALDIASRALAPLVESHAPPGAVIVLMPVPSSTNTLIASHSLATEIARHTPYADMDLRNDARRNALGDEGMHR